MHICFLSMDYPSAKGGGGVGSQVQTLGRALVAVGHRVTVIALAERGREKFQEENGLRVHRVTRGNLHWYLSKIPVAGRTLALAVRELEYAWAVYREVRWLHDEQPFDVIEGTETGALFVALWAKVPVVIRLHGEEYTFRKYTPDLSLTHGVRLSRLLQRAALRRARLLISPSEAHAREISGELEAHHPPVEVVPNTLAETTNGELSPTRSCNSHRVLYVGRLQLLKGLPVLLEAASRVLQEVPGARFFLAGGQHPTLPKAELKAMVDRFGLNGCIQFLGHVPREQLEAYYRQASLCVLPSYYETFGISALEAMACGVPVVASSAGGLPEVVDDGATGILVPPGNSKALASAVVRLLRDDAEQERLGKFAREQAKTRFGVNRHLGVTLGLYDRAVQRQMNSAYRIPIAGISV